MRGGGALRAAGRCAATVSPAEVAAFPAIPSFSVVSSSWRARAPSQQSQYYTTLRADGPFDFPLRLVAGAPLSQVSARARPYGNQPSVRRLLVCCDPTGWGRHTLRSPCSGRGENVPLPEIRRRDAVFVLGISTRLAQSGWGVRTASLGFSFGGRHPVNHP